MQERERQRCDVGRRRDLSKEYKERKRRGGVYTITNSVNGRYVIGYAVDLASIANRFQFAVSTGAAVDPRLRADWETYGPSAFRLDVLEELEQKPEQTQAQFLEDLQTLERLWRANLDATLEY